MKEVMKNRMRFPFPKVLCAMRPSSTTPSISAISPLTARESTASLRRNARLLRVSLLHPMDTSQRSES